MSNYNQPIAINGQPFVPGAVYEMQTNIQPQSIEKIQTSSQDEFFFGSLLRVASNFNNNIDLAIYAYIQGQMVKNRNAYVALTKRVKNEIADSLRGYGIVSEKENVSSLINLSIKRMYHNDIIRYLGDSEFVLNPNLFINNTFLVEDVIYLWNKTPVYVKGPSKIGGPGRPKKSND